MSLSFSLKEPFKPRPTILLMGDSLTQLGWEGWAAHLAHIFQRRADVVNRGFGGYNTTFYLQLPDETVFPGLVAAQDNDEESKCCLVLLWFGANDSALPGLADHHYVSLPDFKANLHKLIDRVQSKTKCARIMLLTAPPIDEAQRLEYQKIRYGDKATGKNERTMENTAKYASLCAAVAQERSLPCCDLYTLMLKERHWQSFLCDGLHFSQAGHEWLGPTVVHSIQTAFPELVVTPDPRTGQYANSGTSCPLIPGNTDAPYHDEVDHTKLSEAFVNYQGSSSS